MTKNCYCCSIPIQLQQLLIKAMLRYVLKKVHFSFAV